MKFLVLKAPRCISGLLCRVLCRDRKKEKK